MRNRWMRISSASLVAAAVGTVIWVNAGSLTPPVGPVSPTMKTLVQVEPRTDVQTLPGAGDAVYLISQPGSYYLTGNVAGVSGKNGIKIDSDNVTLDLRGFTVQGISGSGTGIWASNIHTNVAVRNGTVTGWDIHGVDFGSAHNVQIEGIRASLNGGHGIAGYYSCAIRDCVSESNQGRGFSLYNAAAVSHCSAVFNQDDGFLLGNTCTVTNSTAESNGGKGFNGTTFGEATQPASNNTYQNCTVAFNSQDGFFGGNANTFANCTAENNGGDGIYMQSNGTVTGCSASNNGISGVESFDDVTVVNTTANANGYIGIYVDSGTISNCTANNNGSDGINDFFSQLTVTASTVCNNGDNGILLKDSCKVEGCTVANNGLHGIVVDPSTNPIPQGCQIRKCLIRLNLNNGIQVTSNCLVEGNQCESNGSLGRAGGFGSGIEAAGAANRIDANNVVHNDMGIKVNSSPNLVIRNSADGNTTNYQIVANNKVGVIAAAPNSLAIGGSTGGAGVGSTDPWANFSY